MTYLLVLIALLGCMALLDARFRLFFFARPGVAAVVMVLGVTYFLCWDVWAIAAGIFLHRDSPLMTGVLLGPELPLEEPVFLAFLCYQTMVLFAGFRAWRRHRNAGRHRDAGRTAGPAAGPAPRKDAPA